MSDPPAVPPVAAGGTVSAGSASSSVDYYAVSGYSSDDRARDETIRSLYFDAVLQDFPPPEEATELQGSIFHRESLRRLYTSLTSTRRSRDRHNQHTTIPHPYNRTHIPTEEFLAAQNGSLSPDRQTEMAAAIEEYNSRSEARERYEALMSRRSSDTISQSSNAAPAAAGLSSVRRDLTFSDSSEDEDVSVNNSIIANSAANNLTDNNSIVANSAVNNLVVDNSTVERPSQRRRLNSDANLDDVQPDTRPCLPRDFHTSAEGQRCCVLVLRFIGQHPTGWNALNRGNVTNFFNANEDAIFDRRQQGPLSQYRKIRIKEVRTRVMSAVRVAREWLLPGAHSDRAAHFGEDTNALMEIVRRADEGRGGSTRVRQRNGEVENSILGHQPALGAGQSNLRNSLSSNQQRSEIGGDLPYAQGTSQASNNVFRPVPGGLGTGNSTVDGPGTSLGNGSATSTVAGSGSSTVGGSASSTFARRPPAPRRPGQPSSRSTSPVPGGSRGRASLPGANQILAGQDMLRSIQLPMALGAFSIGQQSMRSMTAVSADIQRLRSEIRDSIDDDEIRVLRRDLDAAIQEREFILEMQRLMLGIGRQFVNENDNVENNNLDDDENEN